MSHDDFDFEPIRGLPARLPAGERLLWQGSPRWTSLAVRAYHVRKAAVYFALIVAYRIAIGIRDGHSAATILLSCAFILTLGAVGIGLLALLAYFSAKATVYSITTQRVLLRHGVAVPMTMNVPLNLIDAAEVKMAADGSGDIAMRVARDQRVGYLITWPHLRPGFVAKPQPSFRALADAECAADILSNALAQQAGVQPVRIEPQRMPDAVAA